MKHSPKDVTIQYCKESGCPVQKSIDNHRAQCGPESDIKLIKDAYCVRCDVYRIRKWLERKNIVMSQEDDDPTRFM